MEDLTEIKPPKLNKDGSAEITLVKAGNETVKFRCSAQQLNGFVANINAVALSQMSPQDEGVAKRQIGSNQNKAEYKLLTNPDLKALLFLVESEGMGVQMMMDKAAVGSLIQNLMQVHQNLK